LAFCDGQYLLKEVFVPVCTVIGFCGHFNVKLNLIVVNLCTRLYNGRGAAGRNSQHDKKVIVRGIRLAHGS